MKQLAKFCNLIKSRLQIVHMKVEIEEEERLGYLMQRSSQQKSSVKSVYQVQVFDEQASYITAFQNLLYVGTNSAKVLVCYISKSPTSETLIFNKVNQFYPHCTFIKLIKVTKKFLVIIPNQEQQMIRIWDREKLQVIQVFKGHSSQITSVLFLKDGKHIASISHDSTARIWNIFQYKHFGKEKWLFESMYPLLAIQQIDQTTLALGGDDCCITLWNWRKQQTKCVVFGHPGSVYSLSLYAPFLVSSGGDSHIKIWSIRKQIVQNASKISSQNSYEKKQELNLVKQIAGQVGQRHFFFQLPNYRMQIIDSFGKKISINEKLQVKAQKFQLQNFQQIASAQIWKEYLLFVCDYNENQQKKPINIVKMGLNEGQQFVNGFLWNKASYIEINKAQNYSQYINKVEERSSDLMRRLL